ncbi:hypothetical protein PCH_Pc20g14950 [Penicillium rubens Wisconsin 54-1255]|uniref:Uncharacterized protein n=1 Tax=Penicillium rubens (strain ATCC 28089 / DSM 1075 / NRRL 1951 / Wisconsin 54-1255) TaxID=500485 RepID=B6HDV2_PENRW|nr:hypothetical protein PCH_Pc20g14950 [Penicillium rubens Wisconsin 54-1255]
MALSNLVKPITHKVFLYSSFSCFGWLGGYRSALAHLTNTKGLGSGIYPLGCASGDRPRQRTAPPRSMKKYAYRPLQRIGGNAPPRSMKKYEHRPLQRIGGNSPPRSMKKYEHRPLQRIGGNAPPRSMKKYEHRPLQRIGGNDHWVKSITQKHEHRHLQRTGSSQIVASEERERSKKERKEVNSVSIAREREKGRVNLHGLLIRDFEGEEAGRKEVQGKSVDEEGAGGAFHSSASGYKVKKLVHAPTFPALLWKSIGAAIHLLHRSLLYGLHCIARIQGVWNS